MFHSACVITDDGDKANGQFWKHQGFFVLFFFLLLQENPNKAAVFKRPMTLVLKQERQPFIFLHELAYLHNSEDKRWEKKAFYLCANATFYGNVLLVFKTK